MNKKLIITILLIILIIIICLSLFWLMPIEKKPSIDGNLQTPIDSNGTVTETNNKDFVSSCRVGSVVIDDNTGEYLQSGFCNEKMGTLELDNKTGLPRILIDNSAFKPFLEETISNNLLPFSLYKATAWSFYPLYQTREIENSYRWDQSNNPIFFTSDATKRSFSEDKRWAIELFTDSPDYFVNIFDLKNKCTLRVDECGSLCSFGGSYDGIAWFDRNTFAAWGSSLEDAFISREFVNIYYIGESVCKNTYMSKSFEAEPL